MPLAPHRPRLELSVNGTGPIPRPDPAPLAPAGDLAPLEARLRAAQLASIAIVSGRILGAFPIIPHNELARLNADLAEVRRLNAGLGHQHRLASIAAWPEPRFVPTRLHAHRDILPTLDLALRIVEAAAARNEGARA